MNKIDQLSIGLITYGGSKYLDFKQEHQNFQSLLDELGIPSSRGIIIDDDKYSQCEIDISFREFTIGLIYYFTGFILGQLRIVKYSRFRTLFKPFFYTLISILYAVLLLLNYLLSRISNTYLKKFQNNVVRQKNITNNHIDAIRRLLNTETSYILILEDDFLFKDKKNFQKDLRMIIDKLNEIANIKILNISESFTEKELGIHKNKINVHSIKNEKKSVINQYRYPVMNTACAILYKKEICLDLIQELEKLNKFPFIPIDHKLNMSLSKLIKQKRLAKSCYASVVPGLLIQGSLHA